LLVGGNLDDFAVDTKHLGTVGEADIAIEFSAGADGALFEPAVGFVDGGVFRGEKRRGVSRRCLFVAWVDCL
jgi:hypothetical protein